MSEPTGPQSAFERRSGARPSNRRTRWERRDLVKLLVAALAGLAFGALLHFVDSLPPDQASLGVGAKIVFAVALLITVAAGTMQYAAGRPLMLGIAAVLLVTTVAGYPFGPAVASGVGVPGTYSLTIGVPGGVPGTVEGSATCGWASGRRTVASVGTGTFTFPPPAGVSSPTGSLAVDFYGSRINVESDTAGYLRFGDGTLAPADVAEPPRSSDNASGSIHVDVLRTRGEEGSEQLVGTLRWSCPPAPPT